MKLVIKLTPFVLQQTVYTLNDKNEIINSENFLMEDINKIILGKENISEVVFCGNKHYLSKFVQAAKEAERARKNSVGYKLGKKVVNKTVDKAINKGLNSIMKNLFK